jgi:Ca2+-binding RTX toxin-like protein
MTKLLLAVLTMLAALAVVAPGAALADNTLSIVNGDATFRSEDPGISNQFVVEDATGANAGKVRFYEPKDPFGINFPPACNPGETRQGPGNTFYTVEAFCPKSLVSRSITIEAGPAEDGVRYAVKDVPGVTAGDTGADVITSPLATNDFLSGDQGNDTIDAGAGDDEVRGEDGNDVLKGGDGNDKLFGGSGADSIDGGNGDDTIQSNDGVVDKVACGPGNDSVVADTVDELTDCETVQRQIVAPPSEQPGAEDHSKPTLQAGGSTSQRITRKRRWIFIAATSSEKGLIQAAGFLEVAGINDRLKPQQARVDVAGGGVRLRMAFNKRQMRMILRDLSKGRRPRVRLTVSSVDAAGNTSRAKHFFVRLRR